MIVRKATVGGEVGDDEHVVLSERVGAESVEAVGIMDRAACDGFVPDALRIDERDDGEGNLEQTAGECGDSVERCLEACVGFGERPERFEPVRFRGRSRHELSLGSIRVHTLMHVAHHAADDDAPLGRHCKVGLGYRPRSCKSLWDNPTA